MIKFLKKRENRSRTKFLNFVKDKSKVKKILLIRNGLLGDVTSTTSVLNRLNNTFSEVEIDVITGPSATKLMQGFPGVKNIFPFNFNFAVISIIKQLFFFWGFRKNKYDILLVQEVNTHYTIITRVVKPKFTVGFTNQLSFLYDYSVVRPKIPMVLAEMETVKEWTVNTGKDKSLLYISNKEAEQSRRLLESFNISPKDFIAILHPGSSDPNSDRQWVLERYSELAERIVELYDAKIIFTGVNHDQEIITHIQGSMKTETISLAGKTDIRTFLALVQRANLVVGPDTGIIHIAAAFDTPVVMMMGLSDEKDTGPFNPTGKARVARVNLPCSPCVAKNPKPEQWEMCKDMRPVECMRRLSTDLVINEIKKVLNSSFSAEIKQDYNKY